MLSTSVVNPLNQPLPALLNTQQDNASPLHQLTTCIQHYIARHSSGLPIDEQAEFIRQCQQVCLAIMESVTSHTPLSYQAQSQNVQGLFDLLNQEDEPHFRQALADPPLRDACTLFIAIQFKNLNDCQPKDLYELAEKYAEGSVELKDDRLAFVLYQYATEHGWRDAIFNLARCYDKGAGVEKMNTRQPYSIDWQQIRATLKPPLIWPCAMKTAPA